MNLKNIYPLILFQYLIIILPKSVFYEIGIKALLLQRILEHILHEIMINYLITTLIYKELKGALLCELKQMSNYYSIIIF